MNDVLASRVLGGVPKVGRTVNNRRLRQVQHLHSAVVAAAGLAGVVAAVWLAVAVRPVSWADVAIFLAFFLAVEFGVTVGFHRHFTHRGFRAVPAVRIALAVFGSMAGQGPVTFWVALHRFHHEFADHEGDPHSPNLYGTRPLQRLRGLAHAYFGWTLKHEVPNANFYARDLLTDRGIMFVNHYYYAWIVLGLALPALILGLATHSWLGALEGFVWGGLVRMFACHNMIWWITSFAHVFGRREYRCKDLSTNNIWIALPTLGEGWHNNHHAFPTAAILSFEWWQIDPSGMVVALLRKLGLAWDVQVPTRDMIAARKLR